MQRRETPLILAFPHGGTELPDDLKGGFRSAWLAVRDADWHIRTLYDGLADATMIWTEISRAVIDCNRDPSGASLYPGQPTTGLCPTETFDGEPLYRDGFGPDIAARRETWFDPYHAAVASEIARLRAIHPRVVVYDCHSIRSHIPRLFEGILPLLNIGTNDGVTCDPALSVAILAEAGRSGRSHVLNGRFRGGWTTRHYGRPTEGLHAIQMEIALRAYVREPEGEPSESDWPPVWDPDRAAPLKTDLARILEAAMIFAKG